MEEIGPATVAPEAPSVVSKIIEAPRVCAPDLAAKLIRQVAQELHLGVMNVLMRIVAGPEKKLLALELIHNIEQLVCLGGPIER